MKYLIASTAHSRPEPDTACTSRSLHERTARRALWTGLAEGGPSVVGSEAAAGGAAGQLRAAQAWRVEPPAANATSVAQASDSRASGTSAARG